MDRHVPATPITFIVSGQEQPTAPATRGAAAQQISLDVPRGRVKQSVRVGAQRAGGAGVRVEAVPGEDVVVMHIAGGPALVLHPEHARDLMLAQQGEARTKRRARGEATDDLRVVAVPVQLRWRGVEEGMPAGAAKRGLFGDVVLAGVEVVTGVTTDKAADYAASKVVELVDSQVVPGVYALRPDLLLKLKGSSEPLAEVPSAPEGAPLLVFIHGTFSETHGTFSKLWTEHPHRVRALFEYYDGRVYALEHPTLGASPIANALTLAQALPSGARLHLVTHSRGGLVGEVLARVCANPRFTGEDFSDFEKPEYESQLADLKKLGAIIAKRGIRVDRFVRVGCPSRGTLLASKRLDAYLSVFKWTLELANIPIAPELLEFLGHVAQRRADPKLIPGLAAQIPDSPLVQWLHSVDDAVPGELRVISGDTQGDSVTSWLKTLMADAFYWTDNDLVVQTRSMYGGAPREAGAMFLYDRGGKVSHFNYFGNERTAEAVVNALTQTDPPGFRTIGPLSWRGDSSTGVRAALRSRDDGTPASEKPAVFMLPGILGSNLKVDGKRIWLDRRFVNGLKKLSYKLGELDGVEPDGPLDGVYDALELYLAETHEVKEFAFDWRKPIEEEAKRLATEVDAALSARAGTGQPVRIIAHSMGGLVARTMQLERPDVWQRMMSRPGARFVMLGTPNQGSWAPMQVLSGDDDFGNLLVAAGALFQDKKARTLMAQFPGFIQLQAGLLDPAKALEKESTWRALAEDDIARVRDYNFWHTEDHLAAYEWGIPSDTVLERAVALRKRLDAQREDLGGHADKVLLVVGRAPFTPDGYETSETGLYYLDAQNGGDGRVTLANARLPNVRTWQVDSIHGDLPGKKEAFKGYLDLLQNGTTEQATLELLAPEAPVARGITEAVPVHVRRRPSRDSIADRPPESPREVLAPATHERRVARTSSRPALVITVTNGDLMFVRYPLMLGHYRSMRLTGTEQVMDRLIGHTMSESLAMGQYPDATGEHQVFVNTCANRENPWQMPRPEAVVIVGLGEEGKLRLVNLQKTIVLGVLAWSQRVKEKTDHMPPAFELAATLIGSGGIGITVAEAAHALVRGVTEANEQLVKRHWPQVSHLHLIELYLDRASEAWRALHVEAEAQPGRYLVAEAIEPGTGGLKRPLESGYRGAPYDFIKAVTQKDVHGDSMISYTLDTRRARSEVRAQKTQGPLLRELLTKASNNLNDDEQVGRTLFQLLVPLEMRSFLSGTSEMQLELDRQTASIPWELLDTNTGTGLAGIDETPWAIRAKLLRKLQTDDFRPSANDAGAEASVLVIGEPLADPDLYPPLPGARQEALAVAERLRPLSQSNATSVKSLISADGAPGPDARQVINALLAREWRIVHIAGHGEPPLKSDPRGVVLSNGAFLGPREICNMEPVPALVFVNCCHLAAFSHEQLVKQGGRKGYDRSEFAAGVAEELIKIGVRCVVAAGWAVSDDAAKLFATTFYDQLLAGRRFIDAVAAARKAAWKPHDNTWAAYQCYGDPEWRLTRETGDAQRPARPLTDEFASVASSDALILALETIAVRSRYEKAPVPQRFANGALPDERAHEQAELRAEALRLEQQRAKIRHLESRFERLWGSIGAVAEAFGAAWAASSDQAAAVKWYEKAVAAPDATASMKATEQLANLRVRLAWASVDRARAKGKEKQRLVSEARKTIEDTIKVLEDLVGMQPSLERESLLGSAYKRLAMIDAAVGRDDEPAIRKMKEHYSRAEKLGREAGFRNVFYPALNCITAEVALNVTRSQAAKLNGEALERVRKLLASRALEEPDFWSVSGPTELEMWEALEQRALAPEWPAIAEAFDDLYARVSSPSAWGSVYDNARFVLTRYLKHAEKEDEKTAAQAVLKKLQALATGSAG